MIPRGGNLRDRDQAGLELDMHNLTCKYGNCGVRLDYAGRGRPPKWCNEHRHLAAQERRRELGIPHVSFSNTCTVDECDRPLAGRGMCQKHWRRWARQTGRERPEGWSQARYERWKKRQDQKRVTQVEPIRNVDVFERDRWTCGLCSMAIDPSLAWPDPMCATLDHITPLSEGGTHTWENVQAAHARCNIQKGSSVAA